MKKAKKKDLDADLLEEAKRIDRDEVEPPGGRWVFVRPTAPKEPSMIYSIRVPVGAVERLRLLADARGKQATALVREWVLERLDSELEREVAASSRRVARVGEPPAPYTPAPKPRSRKKT